MKGCVKVIFIGCNLKPLSQFRSKSTLHMWKPKIGFVRFYSSIYM